MNKEIKKLKGMTWSHERGVNPLLESSRIFKEKEGIEITWDARSLSDFELFPLEELAEKYDLIMIDHPHIGIANEKQLLLPLENILSSDFLKDQEEGSVGQSFSSYKWEKHQYALPLDAAAQVGAYRKDILDDNNIKVPSTWNEVFEINEKLNSKIAIPFVPVHAYSSFFTLCSHFSKNLFWTNQEDLSFEAGEKALSILIKLLKIAHPKSKDMDPIDMLELMGNSDEIAYSPLVYGYSNYSRKGYKKDLVYFTDMPKVNTEPNGSMIGGVGLAISTKCKNIDAAVKFLEMVAPADFQKTVIFDADGQPGHIEAWRDSHVNKISNNFFIDTLKTLQLGSMRPRFDGYIDFQAEAGKQIREFVIKNDGNKRDFIANLNSLIKKCRDNHGLK